jgi:endonuclease/exonuclease/phosphatase family metal-dependent hydrolase
MIKVVSYNVHGNAGSVIETLQRLDADIVCLNEVYEGSIEYLADELEMDYSFFGPSHSKFGNGLLSKFPIITTKNHVLNSKSEKKHSRSLIEAQIQFTLCNEEEIEHEVILDVFITHLEHISERVRLKQMEEVMDIIQQSKR